MELRDYQQKVADSLEKNGKVVALLPRRSGKTSLGLELCLRQCDREKSNVYFIMPFYWDCDWKFYLGNRLRSYKKKIYGSNKKRMAIITFSNESQLIICGSYNLSLISFNDPLLKGIVFDEYALHKSDVQHFNSLYINNDYWILWISTPKDINRCEHLYDLYRYAKGVPHLIETMKFTIDDTKHLDPEIINRLQGESDQDFVRSSFYCEFPGSDSYEQRNTSE